MPTYIIMFVWHIGSLLTYWPRFYQSAGLVATTDWLERNASYADGVLAAYNTSTIIPARAPVRVTLGHLSETIDVDARKSEVQNFFNAGTSDRWRRELLARLNLNYVWYGPEERALGTYDPAQASYLQEAYSAGDVRLYRVKP